MLLLKHKSTDQRVAASTCVAYEKQICLAGNSKRMQNASTLAH